MGTAKPKGKKTKYKYGRHLNLRVAATCLLKFTRGGKLTLKFTRGGKLTLKLTRGGPATRNGPGEELAPMTPLLSNQPCYAQIHILPYHLQT